VSEKSWEVKNDLIALVQVRPHVRPTRQQRVKVLGHRGEWPPRDRCGRGQDLVITRVAGVPHTHENLTSWPSCVQARLSTLEMESWTWGSVSVRTARGLLSNLRTFPSKTRIFCVLHVFCMAFCYRGPFSDGFGRG
jgi:hypothetical protein